MSFFENWVYDTKVYDTKSVTLIDLHVFTSAPEAEHDELK